MELKISPPFAEDEVAFIEAVERSRELHAPWVAPPDTHDRFVEYVARSTSDQNRCYLIRHDEGLVGVVNVNNIVRGGFMSAYLGYYAFVPRRGIFEGGFRRVLEQEVFGTLGLHRVEANIQPSNVRSIELVRRAGFVKEGFSPRYLFIDGAWRDHERWAMLAMEDRPPR